MAETSSAAPTWPVIDDADAPLVYATELVGVSSHGDDVNLVFGVLQHDHGRTPPSAYRKVCLRLVVPRTALAQAHQFLSAFLASRPAGEQGKPAGRPN